MFKIVLTLYKQYVNISKVVTLTITFHSNVLSFVSLGSLNFHQMPLKCTLLPTMNFTFTTSWLTKVLTLKIKSAHKGLTLVAYLWFIQHKILF